MNALTLYLVLALLCGHGKPHPKKPKPDPLRYEWIQNCRHIGWATEYPECRLREA